MNPEDDLSEPMDGWTLLLGGCKLEMTVKMFRKSLGTSWVGAVILATTVTSCDCVSIRGDSGQIGGQVDAGDAGNDGGPDSGVDGGHCDEWTIASEQQLFVDGQAGVDAFCCGAPNAPCNTISYAMGAIQDAGATSVEVLASNADGSSIWTAPETWPITLSNGVTLTAPDLTFNPPAPGPTGASTDFVLEPNQPSNLDLEVTIQGDPFVPGRVVRIGIPPVDGGLSPTITAIEANAGRRLRVNNAWIHDHGSGIVLFPGAELTIGPLPVVIGTNDGLLDPVVAGYGGEGISTPFGFARVTDEGNATLRIDGHSVEIALGEGSEVSLTHGPHLGLSPGPGFSCPDWSSEIGLSTLGAGDVDLGSVEDPATISCSNTAGLAVQPDAAGTGAAVRFSGSLLNNACWGADIHAGHLQITQGSTIRYNRTGIWVDGDAGLDFDDFGTPIDLSCNAKFEIGEDCAWNSTKGPTDAALAITSTTRASAVNALWSHWSEDAGTPVQTWTCASFYDEPCDCSGPECPFESGWPWPAPTDLTLSAGETVAGSVTFVGGAASSMSCDLNN